MRENTTSYKNYFLFMTQFFFFCFWLECLKFASGIRELPISQIPLCIIIKIDTLTSGHAKRRNKRAAVFVTFRKSRTL